MAGVGIVFVTHSIQVKPSKGHRLHFPMRSDGPSASRPPGSGDPACVESKINVQGGLAKDGPHGITKNTPDLSGSILGPKGGQTWGERKV